MKIRHLLLSSAIITVMAAISSCSGKSPSVLVPVVDKLNLDLAAIAEQNPMFLSEASADFDSISTIIEVRATICDSIINVEQISDALMQYYTAQQLKDNPGVDLDNFLNGLTAEEGDLDVILSDVYDHTRTYSMDASLLKKLLKNSPMQLQFNDVKANVIEILSERCEKYRAAANALECTLEIDGGFATYTLTFKSEAAYKNLNQGSLKGRYLHFLQPVYEDLQSFRFPIEALMNSLGIEGYRFVYTTEDGTTQPLKVAIPWRNI